MVRSMYVAAAMLLAAAGANAQVSTTGKWAPGRYSPSRAFALRQLDNARLLAAEDPHAPGFTFAHPVDVVITTTNAGEWVQTPEGRVWTVVINSKTAKSLSLTFDRFHLPKGAEMFVYSKERVLGAYTSANHLAGGGFAVLPLATDSITVEVFVPAGVTEEPEVSISKVAHGYKPLSYGDSGLCNNDVACFNDAEWASPIRGVGMLLTQFGSRYCSGSLINNARNDGTQYFLSANHCMGSSIATDVILFNYQSPSCEVRADGETTDSINGLAIAARYASSDFALLTISNEIPERYNAYLNGFSAENVAATNVVGIHHPSGDIKKISFANITVTPTRWSGAGEQDHWRISSWTDGTTEGGSSGSPLFDSSHYIIGQLHGGSASCTSQTYDSYGAVWSSFTHGLAEFLDPDNTDALVVRGIDLNAARAMHANRQPKK